MEGLSAVYLAGHRVDWRGLSDHGPHRIVDLPSYPFQRQRYWFREKPKTATRAISRRPGVHPLLGPAVRSPARQKNYQSVLGSQFAIVCPSTSRTRARSFCRRLPIWRFSGRVPALNFRRVRFWRRMSPSARRCCSKKMAPVVSFNTSFEHSDDDSISVSISSAAEDDETGAWVEHATARLRRGIEPASPRVALDQIRAECATSVPVDQFYRQLEAHRSRLRRRVQNGRCAMARSRASPRSCHAVAGICRRDRGISFPSRAARWMSSGGRGRDRLTRTKPHFICRSASDPSRGTVSRRTRAGATS